MSKRTQVLVCVKTLVVFFRVVDNHDGLVRVTPNARCHARGSGHP